MMFQVVAKFAGLFECVGVQSFDCSLHVLFGPSIPSGAP